MRNLKLTKFEELNLNEKEELLGGTASAALCGCVCACPSGMDTVTNGMGSSNHNTTNKEQ